MILFLRFLSMALFLNLIISCGDEADDIIISQEKAINRLIDQLKAEAGVTVDSKGGVNYILLSGDDIAPIHIGDSVWFNFYARTLSNTDIFATNIKDTAIKFGLDTTLVFEPIKVVVGKNTLLPGVDLGLQMGHLNDEALLIFNSSYGYGGLNVGVVPANSPLIFWIEIINAKSN